MFDYIELFDGSRIISPSLGTYCGKEFSPVSTSQRYLTIQFISNRDDTVRRGFKLRYNFTSDCKLSTCISNILNK